MAKTPTRTVARRRSAKPRLGFGVRQGGARGDLCPKFYKNPDEILKPMQMQKLDKYNVNYSHGKINDKTGYHLFQRLGQPIHIKACFLAGSRFETKSGLAHFLEHLLLAGTQKYPNKRLLTTPLENIGGSIGAYTNLNFLTIFVEIAERKDLNFALQILNEVISQPLFDPQAIETERGAILTEIQMRRHNRALRVIDISNTLVYQNTSCGKNTIGDEDSVNSVTKSELVDFYETVFKKNPLVWSLSGDLDEKETIEALGKLYNPTATVEEKFTENLPAIREKTTLLEFFDDNKTDLYFGFRTGNSDEVNVASLDIISTYLAFGRGAKLQDELRYKRGLIYSCRGENFLSFDAGDWYVQTACSAAQAQEVLDIITKELEVIKEKGISGEELEQTKNKLIKNNAIKMQTAKSWADLAAQPSFIMSPEKFLITNHEKAIEKVTSEEIIATAQKYFTADNWYLAMCGPKSLEKVEIKLK